MVDANHPQVSSMVTIFSEYIINLSRVSFVLGILLERTHHVADKITAFTHWF